MWILEEHNLLISALIYCLLLFLNGVGLKGYRRVNKAGVFLRIYLLTIGLVIEPMVNSMFIILYVLFYFLLQRKISKTEAPIVFLCIIACFYIVLDTFYIFTYKKYDPAFNPYIGMLEYIVYFIFYIILRCEKYTHEENKLLISHICIFCVSIFLTNLPNLFYNYPLRMSAIFKNPNLLGIYSVVIFALVIFNDELRLKTWMKNLTIISSISMLFLSFSRVSWLGAIVFLLFFSKSMCLKNKLSIMCIILFVFGITTISNGQVVAMTVSRIVSAFNTQDYSTSDRIVLAQAAWESLRNNPILGNGIRSLVVDIKNGKYQLWSSGVFHPHNAYLETVQSLGIIGAVLFCGIIFLSLRNKKYNRRYFYIIIMFFSIGLLNRLFNEFSTTIWFWSILSFI